MKLIPPEKCPFCGSELTGGGPHTAYYECGAHLWIKGELRGNSITVGPPKGWVEWKLYGHMGECEDIGRP